ncbi:MAG: DUF5063 domain-containing protein [Bacteroidales bacterium]|nr:DUF5063 domain-containing protein [Bacteroidales bacterium]
MEEGLKHPVYSRQVIEFVTVANEYCSFIESAGQLEKPDFILKIQKLLPLLYLKASLIPEMESVLDEGNEKFVTEQEYDFVKDQVQTHMGELDDYSEQWDPKISDNTEPVITNISENLADIYQELKDFVSLYSMGTTEIMNDAVWECRMNYENYWGQILVNALRVIHKIVTSDEELQKSGIQKDAKKSDADDIDTSNWLISKKIKDYRDEEKDV